MHNKSSKRKQKHKASQSLKSKQQAPQQDALDLIDEELQNASDVDRDLGSNPLILPANQKSNSAKRKRQQEQPEEQLSKSQLKKLKQVQLKKERREQLSQVLGQLHSSGLSDEHLTLLRPLHLRGAKETKKQRLRRALKLQRAGLSDLADAEDLLQDRKVRGGISGVEADGSSSSGEDGGSSSSSGVESDQERPAKQARMQGETAAAAAAAIQQPDRVIQLQQHQQQHTCVQSIDQADDQMQVAGLDQAAAAAAAAKDQLAALKAQVAALKAQARLEADGIVVDEDAAEEAAAARTAAAERAAAATAGPTRVVSITRPPAMEEARRQLPIIGLEQEIMEGIAHNDVVVLCGETGSGKTTQVPQFLLEAGYGCPDFPERAGAICVTQPRRVAAISTAERVAAELGVKLGTTVGYQVRHDRRVGNDSAIRFMTDGVLMRQLQSDILLRSYSVILLDEAHERSFNTDLLLGMLSRLVPLRRRLHQQWLAAGQPSTQNSNTRHSRSHETPASVSGGPATPPNPTYPSDPGSLGPIYPLKIVIMSATLRTSDFTENQRLFSTPPPVLTVPTRQFPVTIHFSKHTELQDYLGAAVRKVCRIHRELPGGGILLFLTGQREVQVAVRRIKQAFTKPTRTSVGKDCSSSGKSSNPRSAGGGEGTAGDAAALDAVSAADAAGASDDADLAAGADAAEVAADAVDAALEQDLLDAATGNALDDFDMLERDEDEEDVVIMGGDGWTAEELAAAEARFEKAHGLSLNQGSNQGPAENPASAAAPTVAGQDAAAGAAQQQQQQQQQQRRNAAPVHVLPLYAMLPQAQQAAVFQPVPNGHRLIVVATNVAETSITIPGIRYVVDAGRSKQKLLEANSHGAVARYAVDWISKAAAEQRAGRAGRTGPGHVYRLYSSALFNDNFKQHTDPEIANTSLEGVVLLLKAMGVDKVSNFPFPSPPEREALQSATRCLLALSALSPEPQKSLQSNTPPAAAAGKLTAVGRAMAVFPITPRHSRMLLQLALWQQQQQQGAGGTVRSGPLGGVSAAAAVAALPYAVALAAALSLESPFMHVDALQSETEASAAAKDSGQTAAVPDTGRLDPAAAAAKAENKKQMQRASAAHARFRSSYGDAISSLNVLCAYEAAAAAGEAEEFCDQNFLHARHLGEMSQLRQQLGRILLQLHQQQQGQSHGFAHLPSLRHSSSSSSSSDQGSALQLLQCLMSTVDAVGRDQFDQPLQPPTSKVLEVLRRGLAAGWCDQVSRRVRSADYIRKLADGGKLARHATRYMPASIVEEVYLHPRSCLASVAPEYVVYGDIIRTAKRPYMALVTAIEPHWLADCGSSLCRVSSPLTEPAPFYQPDTDQVLAWHDATYSQHDWPLPRLLLPHPDPKIAAAAFAAALLAGKVLPAMSGLTNALVAPAATAARPELAWLPRVGELVSALQDRRVFSRSGLATVWQQQPQFLRQEVAQWVQKKQRGVLDALWQQLVQEAAEMQGVGGGKAEQHRKGTKKKKK